MREARSPDDWSTDTGRLKNPRERNLRRSHSALLRDRNHRIDHIEVVLAVVHHARELILLRTRGGIGFAALTIPRQKSSRQRTPWNQTHALVDAERVHLTL